MADAPRTMWRPVCHRANTSSGGFRFFRPDRRRETAHPCDVSVDDRLVQRALSRRGVSLVLAAADRRPEPALLRLQAAGVPVAVVREGEDLAAALSAQPRPEAAHG